MSRASIKAALAAAMDKIADIGERLPALSSLTLTAGGVSLTVSPKPDAPTTVDEHALRDDAHELSSLMKRVSEAGTVKLVRPIASSRPDRWYRWPDEILDT